MSLSEIWNNSWLKKKLFSIMLGLIILVILTISVMPNSNIDIMTKNLNGAVVTDRSGKAYIVQRQLIGNFSIKEFDLEKMKIKE
jgi:hypothetical protein